MSRPRITDDDIEKALSWLRDNAHAIGQAKMQAILTERMVGHIEALQMKMAGGAVAAQKRDARATPEYRQAIYDEAVAAGEFEKLRSLRDAAAAKIEAWRTEQSNFRAMKI